MTIQDKLKQFAYNTAYPYIMQQPNIERYLKDICFLLVGSSATGLCTEHSDVDICLLCKQEVFDDISVDTKWLEGKPTEVIIDGIQLHYYAMSINTVVDKIKSFDDITLYVYSNACVMKDNADIYSDIFILINSDEIKGPRYNKAVDTLTRRRRALEQVLKREQDPILRIRISLELVEHLIVCIALKDDLQFDKRKRLYQTALQGNRGSKLRPQIDKLLLLLGEIGDYSAAQNTADFLIIFDYCISYIK